MLYIADPNHYAMYFNAEVGQRDLWIPICLLRGMCREGKAYSIMGAYNRFRGESCCGSPYLLTSILRDKWGFDGYVVSDCGAIDDIYYGHKIANLKPKRLLSALKRLRSELRRHLQEPEGSH